MKTVLIMEGQEIAQACREYVTRKYKLDDSRVEGVKLSARETDGEPIFNAEVPVNEAPAKRGPGRPRKVRV